jgi:hypothetical protein
MRLDMNYPILHPVGAPPFHESIAAIIAEAAVKKSTDCTPMPMAPDVPPDPDPDPGLIVVFTRGPSWQVTPRTSCSPGARVEGSQRTVVSFSVLPLGETFTSWIEMFLAETIGLCQTLWLYIMRWLQPFTHQFQGINLTRRHQCC